MGWWTEHVVPRVVDRSLDAEEVHQLRAAACAGLRGSVLEVGFGSGLNVAHYPPEVERISAVEPSDVAWRLAAPRRAASRVPVVRSGLDGQRLSEATGSQTSVLSTFTMCTIPDIETALTELLRVLEPGGVLHFAEHGRAPDPGVARWQDRLQPVYGRLAGGCHLTRPIDRLIADSGFVLQSLETAYVLGPAVSKPFAHVFAGRAVKPE